MSTISIPPGVVALDDMQRACVDLLTDALDEATKGHITSVAVVVCMKGGIATVMAGKQGADLNLGCDDLKDKIKAEIFQEGNRAKPRSVIMRGRN